MRSSTSRSLATVALAAALSLTACGGSGDGGADPTNGADPTATPTDTTTTPSDDDNGSGSDDDDNGDETGDDDNGGTAGGQPAGNSEGARLEAEIREVLEEHDFTQVARLMAFDDFMAVDAYDEAGQLYDYTIADYDTEPEPVSPEELRDQIRVAVPLDEVTFGEDYDAAQEALVDCTEEKRVDWQVVHTGETVVRGICGPDTESPVSYLRWGEKSWTSLPTDFLSAEGLAFVDEFLADLDLEQLESIYVQPGTFSIGTPEQSAPQPDGQTCPWSVSSSGWSTYCYEADLESFPAEDMTITFSEVMPKILADAEPYGGIETGGFSGGLTVRWPSALLIPDADVPLIYAHAADGERIVVYGLDGEKPDFISGG
ncbi:MAG: hypothetical protein Q4G67_02645 [Actinomycetia bacterium]|nr:hypothetical protein [Actinomycetes bacterium]